MSSEQHALILRHVLDAPLFSGIEPGLLERNIDSFTLTEYAADDVILAEGSHNQSVFLIESGRATVQKKATSSEDSTTHQIAQLEAGEEFGEMSLVDREPVSATIRALGSTRIIELDLSNTDNNPDIVVLGDKVRAGIATRIANRLRDNNRFSVAALERELEENRLRSVAGVFIVVFVCLSAAYTISLKVISELAIAEQIEAYVSPFIAVVFMAGIVYMMWRSPFSFRYFGVTLDGWKPAVTNALKFSILFCVLITAAKWGYVQFRSIDASVFQIANMFASYDESGQLNWSRYVLFGVVYALFCPVQELIGRCGAQAPLFAFLQGSERKRHAVSILASNLLFAASHSHLNVAFMLVTFLPGLFWGWLFMRNKSIVGVSLSHAMIGIYALFALGLEEFLK